MRRRVRSHIINKHLADDEIPYQCTECPFRTDTLQTASNHQKMQHPEICLEELFEGTLEDGPELPMWRVSTALVGSPRGAGDGDLGGHTLQELGELMRGQRSQKRGGSHSPRPQPKRPRMPASHHPDHPIGPVSSDEEEDAADHTSVLSEPMSEEMVTEVEIMVQTLVHQNALEPEPEETTQEPAPEPALTVEPDLEPVTEPEPKVAEEEPKKDDPQPVLSVELEHEPAPSVEPEVQVEGDQPKRDDPTPVLPVEPEPSAESETITEGDKPEEEVKETEPLLVVEPPPKPESDPAPAPEKPVIPVAPSLTPAPVTTIVETEKEEFILEHQPESQGIGGAAEALWSINDTLKTILEEMRSQRGAFTRVTEALENLPLMALPLPPLPQCQAGPSTSGLQAQQVRPTQKPPRHDSALKLKENHRSTAKKPEQDKPPLAKKDHRGGKTSQGEKKDKTKEREARDRRKEPEGKARGKDRRDQERNKDRSDGKKDRTPKSDPRREDSRREKDQRRA